jgi:hypothetical protein
MSELSNEALTRFTVLENSNDIPVRYIRLIASELLKARGVLHNCYKQGDLDAPECVKNHCGEVVLSLCRKCGKGECELTEQCEQKEA